MKLRRSLDIMEDTIRACVLRQLVDLLGLHAKLIFLLSPPSEAGSVDTEDICCLGLSHSIVHHKIIKNT